MSTRSLQENTHRRRKVVGIHNVVFSRLRKKLRAASTSSADKPVVEENSVPSNSPGAPGRSATPRTGSWLPGVFAWIAVVLVAFGLRAFHIGISWNIFQDEIDYVRVSHGVLQSLWVIVDGRPFYLHPPLFFFLEAAYIKLSGINGALIHQIYGVRFLGAAFAGLSAGVFLWLGRCLAGWSAGIAAALIFALDPFVIAMNSHNMLDTPAMLWVLLGYGVLFSALVREDRWPISWRRSITVGVLFGLALLTKEQSAFVTLVPLGMCFVLGWALRRTRSALIVVVGLTVYAPYPMIVYAIGDWNLFVAKKLEGASRLAGFIQITGYNQPDGPSFLATLVSKLGDFATTYALIATGAVAVCILLLTRLGRAPALRLLIIWMSSAYAFLGYAVVFGTLEDPFFYYLVIPAILATTVTMALMLRQERAKIDTGYTSFARRRQLALRAVPAILAFALISWNAFLAHAMVVGVLEDRFLYYLLANSVMAAAAVIALKLRKALWPRVDAGQARAGWGKLLALEVAAPVFLGALVLWSAYTWLTVHTTPDNGYERVVSYVGQLPKGSHIAATSDTAKYLLEDHVDDNTYQSVKALQANGIDYVVVNSELVTEGWNEPSPEVYRWVRNHGHLVYGFTDKDSNLLGVWSLHEKEKESRVTR